MYGSTSRVMPSATSSVRNQASATGRSARGHRRSSKQATPAGSRRQCSLVIEAL